MNKKLIAAAVAAGLAAPMAASADMKISGRVAQDLVFSSDAEDTRSLADWGHARLQFDGSQEAGAVTMYARVALDARTRTNSGTSPAFNDPGDVRPSPRYRDVYVGVRGGFGAIQAGRMPGALKNIEKDPYIATFLEARNTSGVGGGNLGSSSFIDDLLQYSNSFGNVNLVLQYNPTTDALGEDNEHIGAALSGDFGAVRAWVGFNNGNDPAANGATASDDVGDVVKVGASTGFGALTVTAQYEMRDSDVGDQVPQPGDRIFLMGDMDLGGGLSANVAFGMNDRDDLDDDANWYRLAVSKSLTKGATVYAGVTQQEVFGAGDDITNFGVGGTLRF